MFKQRDVLAFRVCLTSSLAIYLIIYAYLIGISEYSNDSWSYFELAKTIFSDFFYQFNTYRSYFSDTQAASFPFGYPILLAGINTFFGWTPVSAVYLNIIFVCCSFILIQSISCIIGLPRVAGLALAIGLVFSPGFIEEVESGRSMPAAIAFVLIGIRVILSSRSVWFLAIGSIFLSTSVLIRFDYLFAAWVALILLLWFQQRGVKSIIVANLCFLVGLMPWIIYSLVFFSKFWISDNSWVALSATRANVLDFPAYASYTLFSDPVSWINKIVLNLQRILEHLPHYVLNQPLLVLSSLYTLVILLKNWANINKINILIVLFGAALSVAPYLLTGYRDERYFAFAFFGITLLLLIFIECCSNIQLNKFLYILTMFLTLILPTQLLIDNFKNYEASRSELLKQQTIINSFKACHDSEPEYTYVFDEEARIIAFKYGALTGNKTALMPRNFLGLDEETRADFFNTIEPYRKFNALEPRDCDTEAGLN